MQPVGQKSKTKVDYRQRKILNRVRKIRKTIIKDKQIHKTRYRITESFILELYKSHNEDR